MARHHRRGKHRAHRLPRQPSPRPKPCCARIAWRLTLPDPFPAFARCASARRGRGRYRLPPPARPPPAPVPAQPCAPPLPASAAMPAPSSRGLGAHTIRVSRAARPSFSETLRSMAAAPRNAPLPLTALHPQLSRSSWRRRRAERGSAPTLDLGPCSTRAKHRHPVPRHPPRAVARTGCPRPSARGLRVIDLSGAWRLHDDANLAVYKLHDDRPTRGPLPAAGSGLRPGRSCIPLPPGPPPRHPASPWLRLSLSQRPSPSRTPAWSPTPAATPLRSCSRSLPCRARRTSPDLDLRHHLRRQVRRLRRRQSSHRHHPLHARGRQPVRLRGFRPSPHRRVAGAASTSPPARSSSPPHLLPIPRGILSTVYVRLTHPAARAPRRIQAVFDTFYRNRPDGPRPPLAPRSAADPARGPHQPSATSAFNSPPKVPDRQPVAAWSSSPASTTCSKALPRRRSRT